MIEKSDKKTFFSLSQRSFYLLFLCVYICPLIFFYFFAEKRFTLVFIVSCLVTLFLVRLFEKKMRCAVGKIVKDKMDRLILPQDNEEVERLKKHIEELEKITRCETSEKVAEAQKIKMANHEIREECERLYQENKELKKEYEKEIGKKEHLLTEYQQTIVEQRGLLEKSKRTQIKLEEKIQELKYEIQSLLHMEAAPLISSYEKEDLLVQEKTKPSGYDLSLILREFVQLAVNYTGPEHLKSKGMRFLDSYEGFTADYRHLFESFREADVGVVFIYSLSDKKIRFTNNSVKTLLGISSERFIKTFPNCLEGGNAYWKKIVSKISETKEGKVKLTFYDKNNEAKQIQLFLALIDNGPFSQHLLGLIMP